MTEHSAHPRFVPGIELSRRLYLRAVQPLLHQNYPELAYSAGLLGSGSEVLSFDTPRSSDHHWGPRVMLFLGESDRQSHGAAITRLFAAQLPHSIDGYPTNFTEPQVDGSQLLQATDEGPINHRIEIHVLSHYLMQYAGIQDALSMSDDDWLLTPQQRVRTLAEASVFHDGLNVLNPMKTALAWYPDRLWRLLLAAQWGRIGQEEPFPGRCAEVGDDLGSRIVTARLVRDVMRLCFLMERRYAPYSKWLGTGFSQLACAPTLLPHLTAALEATSWEPRENALVAAYRAVAAMHNTLNLTEPLPTEPTSFHSRPFRVIHADHFANALQSSVDPTGHSVIAQIGAIDQWVDSTDVLGYPERYRKAADLYARPHPPT